MSPPANFKGLPNFTTHSGLEVGSPPKGGPTRRDGRIQICCNPVKLRGTGARRPGQTESRFGLSDTHGKRFENTQSAAYLLPPRDPFQGWIPTSVKMAKSLRWFAPPRAPSRPSPPPPGTFPGQPCKKNSLVMVPPGKNFPPNVRTYQSFKKTFSRSMSAFRAPVPRAEIVPMSPFNHVPNLPATQVCAPPVWPSSSSPLSVAPTGGPRLSSRPARHPAPGEPRFSKTCKPFAPQAFFLF